MYKCLDCGHLFEEGEQARVRETHGLDTPPYEEYSVCPRCKGDYQEVEPCKICGGYDVKIGEEYCDECMIDIRRRFDYVVWKEFKEEEIEYLKLVWEDLK